MKKKIQLFVLLSILIVIGCAVLEYEEERIIWHLNKDNSMSLTLICGEEQRNLSPWWNEADETYYFFLPAFTDDEDIYLSTGIKDSILQDDKKLKNGAEVAWNEGQVYDISIEDKQGANSTHLKVAFEKSENIPAVFIETNSGSMEYLHENKENEEKGYISIIKADGTEDYSGRLKQISGRGNTTWDFYAKKPYAIKLDKEESLCGMEAGKSWNLLAEWKNQNKMQNKLVMDLATEMGMTYSSQSTWVDLFLNGEYAGNYLLCEAVTVGTGRVEINDLDKENEELNAQIENSMAFIEEDYRGYQLPNSSQSSGGYLLERDFPDYYEKEQTGFILNSDNFFVVNRPKHASQEQILYIKNYMQNIDALITKGDPEYYQYIDLESFVSRFLVDEISLNIDANKSSVYFYKEKDDNKLYAGPVWDYDTAFGNVKQLFGDLYPDWSDYTWSTLYLSRGGLNWYQCLYQDPVFQQAVVQKYVETLPYLEEIVDHKIDDYAQTIKASVNMDSVRWQNEYSKHKGVQGKYETFEEDLKYLKDFLANRLDYLSETWDVK